MAGNEGNASMKWQRMELSYVGNVAAVMQKKSGPMIDPSGQHSSKR